MASPKIHRSRNRVDLYTPAEKAIAAAIDAVEETGCDQLLTEAVVLLAQAKDKVADYVDRLETIAEIRAETNKAHSGTIEERIAAAGKSATSDSIIKHLDSESPEVVASRSGAPRTGHPDERAPAVGPAQADGQHEDYWVLSAAERRKGFVRPLRNSYTHQECGSSTRMGNAIAETYAREPTFYGSTFCVRCGTHFPVAEFIWDGTNELVGS